MYTAVLKSLSQKKGVEVHATNPKSIVGSFRSHFFNLMLRIFGKSENDEALRI